MSERTSQPHSPSRSIDEYARWIAANRKSDGQGDTDVYVAWTSDEVRLIEVGDQYPDKEEVLPFRFSSSPEENFDYPVVIVVHSRETWNRYDDKSRLLPDDWEFGEFQSVEDLN